MHEEYAPGDGSLLSLQQWWQNMSSTSLLTDGFFPAIPT